MEKKQLLDKMRLTKNKELYYGCSSDLLSDFDFITEVIVIYSDDFDFVEEVAEGYMKYIPEEDIMSNSQYIELSLLIGQFVPKNHEYYEFYTKRLDGIYSIFLLHVMMVKEHLEGVSELGFSILLDEFGDRKNVLDYFASRFIDELYHKRSCGTFEDLIHKYCDCPQNVNELGYEEFFIRNLYKVDESLSFYVFNNPLLLKNMIEELQDICDNWYDYEDELSARCVEIIKEWVHKKSEESAYGNSFSYEQVMNEVLLSMNFCELFGIDRKSVFANKSKIISFDSARFKQDLKLVIDKVLIERMTLFEVNSIDLDNGVLKKVLQQ